MLFPEGVAIDGVSGEVTPSTGRYTKKLSELGGLFHDAAAFDKVYAEYRLAPEVTKRRMYYETMERVLNRNPKVVMEGNGVAPFLPLPEMKKRTEPLPDTTVKGGQ